MSRSLFELCHITSESSRRRDGPPNRACATVQDYRTINARKGSFGCFVIVMRVVLLFASRLQFTGTLHYHRRSWCTASIVDNNDNKWRAVNIWPVTFSQKQSGFPVITLTQSMR